MEIIGNRLVYRVGDNVVEPDASEIIEFINSGQRSDLIGRVSTLIPNALVVATIHNAQVKIELCVRLPNGQVARLEGNQVGLVGQGVWYPLPTIEIDWLKNELNERFHGRQVVNLVELRTLLKSDLASYVEVAQTALPDLESGLRTSEIEGKLFPYQEEGLEFLRNMSQLSTGALLADEMGLGKTLQAIALLAENRGTAPSLVVMPGSLLGNWQRELAKFAPKLRVLRHSGARRSFELSQFAGVDLVLTSYDLVGNDFELFKDVQWKYLVLDEAQYIKNPNAQRTKNTKALFRDFSLAITGTPFETNLKDYWSIVDFIAPGFLGELTSFEALFTNDFDSVELLRESTKNLFIRRLVKDVSKELPSRFEIPEWLPMSAEMAASQDSILAGPGNPLVKINSLVLLAQHGGSSAQERDFLESAKLERLGELLSEIYQNGEKAIIFANFDFAIEKITVYLRARFPSSFTEKITGAVASDIRLELIDKLGQANTGVLIINPQAGGVGLNIVHANHVIHFSPLWNPALREQATKRAHRTGQERPVFVRHFLYESSIEEVMWQRQSERIELGEVLLDHNAPKYSEILTEMEKLNVR